MQGQVRRRSAAGASQDSGKTVETAMRQKSGVPLMLEDIDSCLEHLRSAGRVQRTIDNYRRKSGWLYQALHKEGKSLRWDTLHSAGSR